MPNIPRLTQPRKWRSLALAGAAVTLAAPALAGLDAPITLGRAPDARLWLAQSQGGEGGEAGVVAAATDPDAGYLAQLMIVEGHMIAALDLYTKGQTEPALELANHPESEGMMDTVRKALADHAAPDFTAATTAFTQTLTEGAPPDQALAALSDVHAGVVAAMAGQKDQLKTRLDAVVVLVKAASDEYAGAIDAGQVVDVMAYHEAHAFAAIARSQLAILMGEDLTAKAAARALDALTAADDAFSDMTLTTVEPRDPAILAAIAARVELIASSVR